MAMRVRRAITLSPAPAIALAALAGFIAGAATGGGGRSAPWRTAALSHPELDVQYPPGWRRVNGRTVLPRLGLGSPVVIAPRARGAKAGLLLGALPGSGMGPLPPVVMKLLHGPARAGVVMTGAGTQAYRYSHVTVPGLGAALVVYVIPNRSGPAAALACYAPSQSSPYMRTCAEMAGTASLGLGVSGAPLLYPSPAYAQKVNGVIGAVQSARAANRLQLAGLVRPAAAREAAGRVAARYRAAASALAAAAPPDAAMRSNRAVTAALRAGAAAYARLAVAAGEKSSTSYSQARGGVYRAEAQVDRALAALAALGYAGAT